MENPRSKKFRGSLVWRQNQTNQKKKKQKNKKKIWKVLGSATEWVGRGSTGWAGVVMGGQGQYRLFHYPSQIFGISKKLFKMLFLVGWAKKIDIV